MTNNSRKGAEEREFFQGKKSNKQKNKTRKDQNTNIQNKSKERIEEIKIISIDSKSKQ